MYLKAMVSLHWTMIDDAELAVRAHQKTKVLDRKWEKHLEG
jgi:hypothetical protein